VICDWEKPNSGTEVLSKDDNTGGLPYTAEDSLTRYLKKEQPRICILGGGPGGLNLAHFLQKRGYKHVDVYEKESALVHRIPIPLRPSGE
jgi:NADPH-dependent 2,4-dienoyl-CoA reductase/sulfur reductase-like enzyme